MNDQSGSRGLGRSDKEEKCLFQKLSTNSFGAYAWGFIFCMICIFMMYCIISVSSYNTEIFLFFTR